MNIQVVRQKGLEFLKTIPDKSVDLILTDPPYIISRESGMNKFVKEVAKIEASGKNVKTEAQWEAHKKKKNLTDDKYKNNYIKYGNTSGKKYATRTKFGKWDQEFTIAKLDEFVQIFYKKLKKGGTCIIFFDVWKITNLKTIMECYKFKQLRLIEWIKTNPMPLNQKVNYLTNAREIAVLGVKGGKPTFNSKYDKGIYNYPIQTAKKGQRHPTQKSLLLFEDLIKKHSNEGDTVLDVFLGGGTTAIACKNTNRKFKGCDTEQKYIDLTNIKLNE